MEIIICNSPEEASKMGAQIVATTIKNNSKTVLGLATGKTPTGLYKELIVQHKNGDFSFQDVTTFNLDEYVGLEASNPESYRHTINSIFLDHTDINMDNTYVPDGLAQDIPEQCNQYEILITKKGGIDLQILGLGNNGHIGFNEPSSSLASRTRIKTLTKNTLTVNQNSETPPPKHCITMGIGTIMEAKHCILLAMGESKANAVAAFVEGPVTASVPASALQWHPHVTVILDKAAASKLERTEYYTSAFSAKPEWQST